MKVVLVTCVTPYRENYKGTSALPYHLIKGRDIDVDITIYSFNTNHLSFDKIKEVEKELDIKIHLIPFPRWITLLSKCHLLFLRVFFRYPIYNYIKLPKEITKKIKDSEPDLIGVYSEELSNIVKQFSHFKRIQIGPDTESLYYYRMMGQRFVMNNSLNYWKCALMYRKYARMEQSFCTDDNFTYYAVGEEDVSHLQRLNPNVSANFLRHPHYEVKEKDISFHHPKIKLLIAGQYNLYMKQEADLLIEELKVKCEELSSYYTITFLGKGWGKLFNMLKKAGYEVNHIAFAPDYIEEICKHDIQISPIAIGTGTKGKVLDALANGLLVIGTKYAMENIAVKHGESCIIYKDMDNLITILKDIPKNIVRYETMARRGHEETLTHHDNKKIAHSLFQYQN